MMQRISVRGRAAILVAASVSLLMVGAPAASAALAHGQLLHLAPHVQTNQSNNWFGYNQGSLEQSGKQFNAITGDWTVPTVGQHSAAQAESSSDWIGIGGGCVDAGCTVTDSTLIQTGTEQDVDASGHASYSAWYELVPAPSLTISNMTVSPGDHMHASLAETLAGSNVWTHAGRRNPQRELQHHGSLQLLAPDGRVDRGDPAADRHQRRLCFAAQPDHADVRLSKPPTGCRPV